MCFFRSSEGHERSFQDFTPESFRKILDTFPRAIVVNLCGGEPFINPSIFEIIQLAHQRRLKVHIPTNGTLLAGKIDALLKAPVDILNVSFYGTDAASFSQVTGADGSLFDATVEGVAELARRRRRGGYPRLLRTSFVCRRDNLHRVIDFIRLSEKLGVDEAKLKNLRLHQTTGLPESLCLKAEDQEVQAFLAGLRRQRFSIPVFLPRVPRHDDRRKCDHPFKSIAIDGDGFMGPCCATADKRRWRNLFEQPDLWNGPAMIRARRDQMDPASPAPSICLYCEERIPERLKAGG
jgi:MoaA/NifB/PqqE/SkfB family radical SAM enzyme